MDAFASRLTGAETDAEGPTVPHFREILLWPVQLMASAETSAPRNHAALIAGLGNGNPWSEVVDEFTGNPDEFQERHYNEFVTFLPPVQRFLYGSGRNARTGGGRSPMSVLRRHDIAAFRVKLLGEEQPVTLNVAHVDLYFFYDIDIAIMAVELYASDLPLSTVQNVMFQLGRAYPAFWHTDGKAGHCPELVELLGADGQVLATSDYQDRDAFLSFACRNRSPRTAAHWDFILKPLVLHHSDVTGPIRYRQLEYYRMPQMAFLAMNKGHTLSRADYVRLALSTGPGDSDRLPFSDTELAKFENKYCYDRYFRQTTPLEWPESRYMTCGHTLVVTGSADDDFFVNIDHGCLNSFRHENFLLFLIAHFHKASLLMFSDRLAKAVSRLDTADAAAVRSFRLETRHALETFLRFTHRYWFHVISNQVHVHDLFALCRKHLEVDRLYVDVREELQEMSDFLENEAMRRQNETMTRLTVVTTFGLVATIATGFLGMNIFDWAAEHPYWRAGIFGAVLVGVAILTTLTVARSRRLADMMERLSEDRRDRRTKKS
ncbi:MAG: hypothetical protein B7Y80_03790 [Hyphomicrobium sp. 32-62-53]|nr:MAG: hypothetical protein B7Z29_06480 [Hyphomicrobium sp. 12-62-95]OYY01041.1 MAG: hypothetical protein B7Y80_03790 [Hyphomicrobium sp. 32-62-53]